MEIIAKHALQRLALTGALVLLAAVTPRVLAQDVNAAIAIPNSGFEEGGEALSHWTFSSNDGGTGRYARDTKNFAAGQRALRVEKTNAPGYSIVTSDPIPVQAGKSYQVTAKVRALRRSRARVYLMISQYSADSDDMKFPNYFSLAEPIYLRETFGELSAKFPVRAASTRVRVHLVVSDAPATILWDDISLRESDAATSAPPHYEAATPETLPPLGAALSLLKTRRDATGQKRAINGRARLVIDGKPHAPVFAVMPFVSSAAAHIADFKNAGVRVHLVPLYLGREVYGDSGVWVGKDQFDFKEVEERIMRVLRVDPGGYVMFYLACDPYRNWAVEHPRAILKDQNGKRAVIKMHVLDWGREPQETPSGYRERYGYSYVSPDLRRDTAAALRRLVAHLQTIPAGKAVVGFHLVGGSDAQFFQYAGFKPDETSYTPQNYHLADYSDDSRDAFRNWLRRKYKTVNALRAAWKQPDANFEAAAIPEGSRRLAPGFFFDPQTDEDIADYNHFYSEGAAEMLAGYARVLKEATSGKKLVSTYWEDVVSGGQSHNATARMLRSPDFDFFAGPTTYGSRMPGFSGAAHSTWSSLALHGRFWVSEQDWRSWHTPSIGLDADNSVGRATNAAQHNAMVRRESGMMLAFGNGTWFYDMDGGWFADEGIMRGVGEAREAFTRDLSTRGPLRADLAVFVDERSMDYIRTFETPNQMQPYRYGLQAQIRALNTAGVPYHLYLQSDLPNLKQKYKTYLFINAHRFDAAEYQALQKLKSGSRVLAFLHAPGVMSPAVVGARNAEEAIAQVTGIRVKKVSDNANFLVAPLPQEKRHSPLAVDDMIGLAANHLTPASGPAWSVDDAQAIPLGIYDGGQVAAATKKMRGWTSVWMGGLIPSDTFVHALAKYSGAWTVADAGDAVYANQHFLTAHAIWDGTKTFTLARPSNVTDLTSGQLLRRNARTISLPMKRGETRWFFLQKP